MNSISIQEHMSRKLLPALALVFSCIGVAQSALPKTITYKDAFDGQLKFDSPVFVTEIPGKPGYFAVLEQSTGDVVVVSKSGSTWSKSTMVHLKVGSANEMGLLGVAFHPNFPQNHKYYLSYNPTADSSRVDERTTDATLIKDDGSPAKVLLAMKQPAANHNGGSLAFNPKEGAGKNYLYMGFGDGGGAGDTYSNSRKTNVFFAKILRIDVDKAENGKNYGIPSDNPFVSNTAYAPEIWAWGARNPWRFSFDPLNGNLWLGDVGQGDWEEVDIVPKGADLGWVTVEGTHCYGGSTCDQTGKTAPILDYSHTIGNCIIGGVVYRGNPSSPFYGVYFYADNGTKIVQAVDYRDGKVQENAKLTNFPESPTSFGTDLSGNVYLVGRDGHVFRFDSPDMASTSVPLKRLRQEKAIRCCLNQKGKRVELKGELGSDMDGLELYTSEGVKITSVTAHQIQSGVSLQLQTGVYIARSLGALSQASALFTVN